MHDILPTTASAINMVPTEPMLVDFFTIKSLLAPPEIELDPLPPMINLKQEEAIVIKISKV